MKVARQFKSLEVVHLLEFIDENGLSDYIPDKADCKRYDRDFLVSVSAIAVVSGELNCNEELDLFPMMMF